MIVALFSILLVITVFLLSCIIHVRMIQKELEEISLEQARQNEDIGRLMIAYAQLISDLKEAAAIARNIENAGWKKPTGEA
jgi:uncharacterized protein YdbL (DUF1318 family)